MNAKSLHKVRISPFGGGRGRTFLCVLNKKTLYTTFADLAKNLCAFAVKRPLFLLISRIFFCFSEKSIIFDRPVPYRTVFAIFYVQFDKRKLTAGFFKLHRLLYFTRAVWFARSEMSHRVGVG